MALPKIKAFTGSPLADAEQPFYSALYAGTLEPATTTEFVVSTDYGYRVVFHGSFTVVGGEVTGGTVTGYDAFAGSTQTLKASGYSFEAAAFFEAVQNYNLDSEPFYDIVEAQPIKFIGSDYGDRFGGTDGADVLVGKRGGDDLYGSDGDDVIKGDKGQDSLVGGDGFDTLTGGSGNDVFVFFLDLTEPPPTTFDKITDFKHGRDHIGLSVYDGIDDLLPPGELDGKYFHKGTEATTADQHVIYDKKTGKIYFDADGSGDEAQFLMAKVKAQTKLSADDFYSGGAMVA
ncbi:MAG: calcium-binding protein [Rhizobiales bacterium]|nr:calcium-binding protein [Hyphomicrobiales bacterium]